ncbi:MAG: type II toxin-antitoxin system RelE/ParE family toxin [Desulfococcaceae bacterium]
MKIRYKSGFKKDLKNIRDKNLLQKIKNIINEIRISDDLSEISNMKKLKGYDSFYRTRAGDFQIGIEIIENELIFVRILNRKDMYRFFP